MIYEGRTIIIQYGDSFMYADIDDKIWKNIKFDLSEYEQGGIVFSFSDDENLYFEMFESHNVVNVLTAPKAIYKVARGTETPVFIRSIVNDNEKYLIDGYLYFINLDYNIERVKLIENE